MGGTGEEEEENDNGIVANPITIIKIMPRLQSFKIWDYPKLKSLLDYSHTASLLKELGIAKSFRLEESYQRGTGHSWPRISHIPNIKLDWKYVQRNDFENSEDDKRTIIASLKKKAINASSKFRQSLKKKRSWKKNGGQINSVSIEDVWDAGELQAVDAFRQALISEDWLPLRHDDCHMLLR
uniref:Uncharacterized protein n=1 Tax=Quercus lobata TaxID=97700 RepID=A0A7N2RAL3_QUELO